ncbi:class C sortase [Streptococcus ovuberis]|uniref:Class C sortase n=1 Tax=Streptococcus ovuberis TaxID=1936207 RepID=A0A7X6N0G4_9STRE|nr:class C sortase [Streptococcus ovuberis]NKZ19942.1 class C sortase [Streptococcus ovuberis]
MRKKKKSFIRRNLPFLLIFIIGFGVLLYPQLSRIYYTFQAIDTVQKFSSEKDKLDDEELKRRFELAQAFNETLHNVVTTDPYSEDKRSQGKAEYARMLEVREQIGHVEVPPIGIDIPVYAGTQEESISRGSGHLEGTSLPIGGINTHAVLTSHAGLPTAKLFTDLKKVKEGDVFYVHNIFETLAYEVDQIKVVEPTDFSNLMVVEGQDYVTLLTCTPPVLNTHRLLVRGHRIPYEEKAHQYHSKQFRDYVPYLIILLAILFGLFLLWLLWKRRKHAQDK